MNLDKKETSYLGGYQKCIEAGEVSTKEKDLVLEFARQFRIISPMTMRGYKEAKEAGQEKIFVAELRAVAEKLTGSDEVTDKERESPYYNDLLSMFTLIIVVNGEVLRVTKAVLIGALICRSLR